MRKNLLFHKFLTVVNRFLMKHGEGSYPVEEYAIKFGRWESETAKDKTALECHAHFHLHIREDVILNMEQKKDNNDAYYYYVIHGEINDPVRKIVKKLETSRLTSLELNRVDNKVNVLSQKVDDLSQKFDDLNRKVS